MTYREDVEGIDASILMHPRVWEASGHVANFTDPMVDCKECKARFRADQIEDAPCGSPAYKGRKAAKCQAEGKFTEARQFNLMFKTFIGPVEDSTARRLSPPGDRAGDLRELPERAVRLAPEAPVRDRADRQGVPERDQHEELPLPDARVRADGDAVLREARDRRGVVRLLEGGAPAVVPRTRHDARRSSSSTSTNPTSSPTTPRMRTISSTNSPSAGGRSRGSTTGRISISRGTRSSPASR